MSNTNETPAATVEGVVIDSSKKKFCFTRKQIIVTAVATTTVVATTVAVVYLKAKGTDPKEIVDVAIEAVKETVENAD